MREMKNIRHRTESILGNADVPIHPHLPLIESTSFRSSEDVARRIVALYAMTGLANGADAELLKEWLVEDRAWDFLSVKEKSTLDLPDVPQEILNELSWKQESIYVLSWSGGLFQDMKWPKLEANLDEVFDLIPPEVSISSFVTTFSLRSASELLEQLDLYYCLHTAAVHPELWGEKKMDLKLEVVIERRQALEWICSDALDWEEVSLDT